MTSRESGALSEVGAKDQPREAGKILSRNLPLGLLRVAAAAATCAVLLVVSIALIDRPVATWIHGHLGYLQFGWFSANYHGHLLRFGPFSLMASPAEALRLLGVLAFAAMAIAVCAGWRPRDHGRAAVFLCLSVFASAAITTFAKEAFGRTWPESWLGDNPSYIRDGVYGFFPFHGGDGWGSFPSGHTSVVATVATVCWLVWPEGRVVWVAMVAIVVAGLLGGNYHFVSDIIASLFLGVAIGFAIAAMIVSPKDDGAATRRPR